MGACGSCVRILALVLSLSSSAACDRAPAPVTAGEGLQRSATGPAVVLAADPSKVPLLEACEAEQVLVRTETGWRCAGVVEALLSADHPTADDLGALELRAAALEQKLAEFPCGLRGRSSQPELEVAASSCLVSAPEGDVERRWWLLGPTLKIRPGQTGRVRVTCPVVPRCGEWDGVWRTLTVYYGDPDGPSLEHHLTATLYAGDQPLGLCVTPEDCTLASSDQPAVEKGTMVLELGNHRPDPEASRRDPTHYRLELELFDGVPAAEIQFRGARID